MCNPIAHNLYCLYSDLLKSSAFRWVMLLLLSIQVFWLPAQIDSKKDLIEIKWFTLQDGLSQVSINDLLQDKEGFVWIGTQDGLNRFDGSEFRHFKFDEKDSLSIAGNHISALLEDVNGYIWVGTIGNGVSFYDKRQEQFHRIQLENSNQENEVITGLSMGDDHSIWIGSLHSGLHKLTPTSDNKYRQKNYFTNHQINTLYRDDQGILWIGCFDGHIMRLVENDMRIEEELILTVDAQVLSLHKWNDQLLIGTDAGLYRYHLISKNIKLVTLEADDPLPTRYVADFLKKDLNEIWVGTGAGLYLYNLQTNQTENRITYSNTQTNSLSNNTIQSLLKINEGDLMVGTANYLNQVTFEPAAFYNLSKNQKGRHILNDNVVFSILKDEDDLWVGTSDGGLNLIKEQQVYYFKEDKNDPNSISGMVIRAILKDEIRNRIWIATTRGISLINGKAFHPENPLFTIFRHDSNNKNSIESDFVKDIEIDNYGILWGVTYGGGFFSLALTEDGLVHVHNFRKENYPDQVLSDFYHSISKDGNGGFWLGSQDGLSHLIPGPDANKILKIEHYTKGSNSLSHSAVYDIMVDDQDRIWVGTRSGLNRLLENGTFRSWTKNEQFPNTIVYSIQNDLEGNLWLATNEGIVRFDPDQETFTHYGDEDGIQGPEFDLHAKFLDDQGNIYLGGVSGLTIFHPDDLKQLDKPMALYFSQLRIRDQIIRPQDATNILLNQSIQHAQELEIRTKDFPFFINFSSIDFRVNRNVKFASQLYPQSAEWNFLDHPEIQFLSLAPGNYVLKVNGFSRGQMWETPAIELNICVLPPWWRTFWAMLAYGFLVISLAYGLYRFQLSRKLALAESKRLKEINTLKNTLYTNITHEFRTPLTVIQGTNEMIASQLTDVRYKKLAPHFEAISRNSDLLLQLVNQLLDLDKIDQGKKEIHLIQSDIIPYLRYLHRSFRTLATKKDLQYVFYTEIEHLIMDFDSDVIFQIVSNLLSNAIKFTNNKGEVIFHCSQKMIEEESIFQIVTKDSGIGIDSAETARIFDRFYQIDTSSTRKYEGTGIGLALVKELIDLVGGSIQVESTIGRGSSFIIQLPITNNAPNGIPVMDQPINFSEPPQQSMKKDEVFVEERDSLNLPIALIIEDNLDLIKYLEAGLQNTYEVVSAQDGNSGIELALQVIPDIIISDIMMPGKDGYELCAFLKKEEKTSHIPIILLTAKTSSQDKLKGLSAGADAYITKPFKKEELMVRMEQMIKLRSRLKKKFAYNAIDFKDKIYQDKEAKFLRRTIQVIEECISDTHFSGAVLAKKLGYSESQLYRKLKALTHQSTAVFIRSIRLHKAKQLLEAGTHNVSEACYEVGFNDPAWFSKSFKKEFGKSPSHF